MADGNYNEVPEQRPEVRMPDERTYYVNIPIHPLTGQVLIYFLRVSFISYPDNTSPFDEVLLRQ
jgi:hypothetical protein